MKLALFDFCETLVNFQTADFFIEYCLKKFGRNDFYEGMLQVKIINAFLNKHWRFRKSIHLYLLKGIKEEDIKIAAMEYYIKYIKTNSFKSMAKLINGYKRDDYKVYIVSGGYSPYIEYYANDHNIDGIISNDFKYKRRSGENIFTGKLCCKDCMGKEKVVRLNSIFKYNKIEDSISYSDSLSDLPLFMWTKRAVLVSKYKERKSAKENNLEQIILANIEPEGTRFEFEGLNEGEG